MTFDAPTPYRSRIFLVPLIVVVALAPACKDKPPADRVRVSGQVEATDVQVSAQVGGRVLELRVAEGDRVMQGDLLARLDTADAELALARANADRQHADAQLRLVLAGARVEDVRQAEAAVAASEAEVRAADAELSAARADVERFEMLLASNSGSRKQRDDAVTRRDVANARAQGARDRVRAARETVGRLRAGARREEIDAAQARVAAGGRPRASERSRAKPSSATGTAAPSVAHSIVTARCGWSWFSEKTRLVTDSSW